MQYTIPPGGGESPDYSPDGLELVTVINPQGGSIGVFLEAKAPGTDWVLVESGSGYYITPAPDPAVVFRVRVTGGDEPTNIYMGKPATP